MITNLEKKIVYRDMRRIWGITVIAIIAIVCFMFFSPITTPIRKGNSSNYMAYAQPIDSLIAQGSLPPYPKPFFAQSLSKGIRFGARKKQIKTYDLPYLRKEYLNALIRLDYLIEMKQQNLPCIAYFDRYLSVSERNKASNLRAEIYELKWKRIQLLEIAGAKNELISALKPYKRIVGYHQEEAKEMYHQLNK